MLVALAALSGSGVARAEEAPATQPSDADLKLAKQHNQLGTTYFGQGAYDKALKDFKVSHRLSKKPELLYNIAKCHELLGQLEQAMVAYQRYLDETGKQDATVQARIQNLKVRIEQAPASAPVTSADPVGQDKAPAEPPSSPPASSWKTIAGWSLVGLGLAAVGAGIAMGVVSGSKSSEVEEAYREGTREWADLEEVESSGEGLELGMIIGVSVGAAAAVSGAVLLLLSRGGAEQRVSVAPVVGADVVGLAGSVRF
jgi:tetratricopeptide (TPR) repeat protein